MSNIKFVKYRGDGEYEILNHIDTHGDLHGEIRHNVTNQPIADVSFTLDNNRLLLTVNDQPFSSICNAIINLPELATHDAEGSSEGGNALNNTIGNYNAFDSVHFGSTTLTDLVRNGNPAKRTTGKPKATPEQVLAEIAVKQNDIAAEAWAQQQWQNSPQLRVLRNKLGLDLADFLESLADAYKDNPELTSAQFDSVIPDYC